MTQNYYYYYYYINSKGEACSLAENLRLQNRDHIYTESRSRFVAVLSSDYLTKPFEDLKL